MFQKKLLFISLVTIVLFAQSMDNHTNAESSQWLTVCSKKNKKQELRQSSTQTTSPLLEQLFNAIKRNNMKQVDRLLIVNSTLVNSSLNGALPLHCAISHGHYEMALHLLKIGALVNNQEKDGMTPLHWAFFIKSSYKAQNKITEDDIHDLVQLLINNDADVNTQTNKGQTPLHFCALQGHTETVQLLLSRGANINVQTNDKNTPLHLAAINNQRDMITLLLQRKPHTELRNGRGQTYYDILQRHAYQNNYSKR